MPEPHLADITEQALVNEPLGELSFMSDGGIEDDIFSGWSSLNNTDNNISFGEIIENISPDDLDIIRDAKQSPGILVLDKEKLSKNGQHVAVSANGTNADLTTSDFSLDNYSKVHSDLNFISLTLQHTSDFIPSSNPTADPMMTLHVNSQTGKDERCVSLPDSRPPLPDMVLPTLTTHATKTSKYMKSKNSTGDLTARRKGAAVWLRSLKLGHSTVPFSDNLRIGRRSSSAEDVFGIAKPVKNAKIDRFLSFPSAISTAEEDNKNEHGNNNQALNNAGKSSTNKVTIKKDFERSANQLHQTKPDIEGKDSLSGKHAKSDKTKVRKVKSPAEKVRETKSEKVDKCALLQMEDIPLSECDDKKVNLDKCVTVEVMNSKCHIVDEKHLEFDTNDMRLNELVIDELKKVNPGQGEKSQTTCIAEKVSNSKNDLKLTKSSPEEKQHKSKNEENHTESAILSIENRQKIVAISDSKTEHTIPTSKNVNFVSVIKQSEKDKLCTNDGNIRKQGNVKINAEVSPGAFTLRSVITEKDMKELKFFDAPLTVNIANLSLSSPVDIAHPTIGPFGEPLEDDWDEFDGESSLPSNSKDGEKPSYVSRLARAYSNRLKRRNATVHRNTRHVISGNENDNLEYR